jgi:membrane carboxypeptidase/penicillin-binding protein PbpC
MNKPDSHGDGRDVERVPLLVRDANGVWHGRFHAINVMGLTGAAAHALRLLTESRRQDPQHSQARGPPRNAFALCEYEMRARASEVPATLDGKDRYYIRRYLMPTDMLSQHSSCMKGRIVT